MGLSETPALLEVSTIEMGELVDWANYTGLAAVGLEFRATLKVVGREVIPRSDLRRSAIEGAEIRRARPSKTWAFICVLSVDCANIVFP